MPGAGILVAAFLGGFSLHSDFLCYALPNKCPAPGHQTHEVQGSFGWGTCRGVGRRQQQSRLWPTSGTPAPQHPGCTSRAEAEGGGRQREARAGVVFGLELHRAGSLALNSQLGMRGCWPLPGLKQAGELGVSQARSKCQCNSECMQAPCFAFPQRSSAYGSAGTHSTGTKGAIKGVPRPAV